MYGSETPSQYVDNFDEKYDVVVVGFGYVRVEASNSSQLTLRRLRVRTAPVNASASPRGLVGSLATASVLEAHAEIGDSLLLTPVLR